MDKWSCLMFSCGILANSFIGTAVSFCSVTRRQGQSQLSFSSNFNSSTVRLRPELDAGQDKPCLVVFKEPLMNLGNMEITFIPRERRQTAPQPNSWLHLAVSTLPLGKLSGCLGRRAKEGAQKWPKRGAKLIKNYSIGCKNSSEVIEKEWKSD